MVARLATTHEKLVASRPNPVALSIQLVATSSFAHVLAGCSALAQTKYMSRHNSALRILFFEILRECGLIDKIKPWYSQVVPKPLYENENHKALWDVPVKAENAEVRANRIDARIINHNRRSGRVLCPPRREHEEACWNEEYQVFRNM